MVSTLTSASLANWEWESYSLSYPMISYISRESITGFVYNLVLFNIC